MRKTIAHLMFISVILLASMPLNAGQFQAPAVPAPISSDNGRVEQFVDQKIQQSIDMRIDQKIEVIRDDAQQQLDYSAMRFNHQRARHIRAMRMSADQQNLNDLACVAFGRNCRH